MFVSGVLLFTSSFQSIFIPGGLFGYNAYMIEYGVEHEENTSNVSIVYPVRN